jgi:glycosyltransferase involved in cell wall biosynthesis
MSELPLVSVVTPFYNTADFLRECIESVLAQTYHHFEYLLVDNQSTDGSAAIAADYARKDSRIRMIRNAKFVAQVPNYNGALRHVARKANYVKVVQADDWIFPECLERMVAVAESHPTAAIISSYRLRGAEVCGSGIVWPTEIISGRDLSRLQLLGGHFLFGSPTTLLYRSDLLRGREPFYSESTLHEDTELCYEILAKADLGFVHQILSFSRVGNGGNLTSIETFFWTLLYSYTTLRKFGPEFLSREELANRIRPVRAEYLRMLGESRLLGREPEFWRYHRRGLATVGEALPSGWALTPQIARAAVKAVVKPWWLWRERTRLKRLRDGSGRSSTIAREEK